MCAPNLGWLWTEKPPTQPAPSRREVPQDQGLDGCLDYDVELGLLVISSDLF